MQSWKRPQINGWLFGRCAAALQSVQDSPVTIGLAKQRPIPMSSVTSRRCSGGALQAIHPPPPAPYLCHKVFQSVNRNPPLTTEASLFLIPVSDQILKVNLYTYLCLEMVLFTTLERTTNKTVDKLI